MQSDKSRDNFVQQITVLDSCYSAMGKKIVTKRLLPMYLLHFFWEKKTFLCSLANLNAINFRKCSSFSNEKSG